MRRTSVAPSAARPVPPVPSALRSLVAAAAVAVAVAALSAAAVAAPPPAPAAPPAAQPAPAVPPPGAATLPVAVVYMERVASECVPGKALVDNWKSFINKKSEEYGGKEREATQIRTRLRTEEQKIKAADREAMEKRATALEREMDAVRGDFETEKQRFQGSIGQVEREAERLLREIAKERGILLVLDPSRDRMQMRPDQPPQPVGVRTIVIDPRADLTNELIARLEKFRPKPVEEEVKSDPADTDAKPQVLLETTLGDIVVELDREKAPVTVNNFLKYAEEKHYDGTIFHRVIDGFMIQGGGFTEKLDEKPTRNPIKNEASNGLKNLRYTVAMARTQIVDSATAQFYINVKDNPALDHRDRSPQGFGYAVFGKVIKGFDAVDKIKAVKTETANPNTPREMENVPVTPVIIKSARRLPADKKVKEEAAPAPAPAGKAEENKAEEKK
jgi:cyclophilin family peptidyl-prolyl cis-trans isomerase/Skp family chaperone for outer membrane proteins